jgi:outer membrane immunogenic protein
MRGLSVVSLAAMTLGLAGTVYAADMPMKAPPLAPPVTNWAGFYLGVHGGWGSGQFTGTYDDGGDFGPMDFPVHGGVAGGQIGYNFQFGRIVHGVELDASWADIKGDITDNDGDVREFKTNFLGSLRYRGGITADNILLYSTIGVGYARSKFTVTNDVPSPASIRLNKWGLVTGLGAEWALAPNWSVRGEYLYYYFGKTEGIPTLTTDSEPTDFVRIDGIHVIRVGANYRFGGTASRPASGPVTNWAGLYIGVHGGYGLSRITGVYDEGGDNGAFAINPRGFIGGGQIGYNWQSGAWVYGVEADGTWGAMKKSRVDTESDTEELKTNLLASGRVRVGITADDKLFYLTGGVGYARSKLTVTGDVPSPATATLSSWGPVVGSGVEWAFAPKWSLRLEGLTYLMNNKKELPALTSDSEPQDFIRQSTIWVTRAGVNYRF